MYRKISKYDDIIDSRDVIDAIKELSELEDPAEDDIYELEVLKKLEEQGKESPDWQYGETLIRESYFTDYAEELAYDLGLADENASWPISYIDWDRAAADLKYDYFTVDFDGVYYLIRG